MVEITRTPIEPGLLMRAVQGVRYAVTGKTPEWFGPSAPPLVSAPEGTPPRSLDYPVGYNLNIRPRSGEATSYEQLRALGDNLDVLRVVIETRKDQLCKLPWTFRLRDSHNQLNAAAVQTDQDPRLDQLEMFFRNPDKEHDWATWLRILLEDLFVLDAPTIFLRKNNGGQPYSLEILDGGTIQRVIDERGRVPDEGPAFRQVIKGVPAVNFEREELIYAPRNPRAHKIFGYGPVEQILMTVNIAIRRQLSQLQFYTEGNVPEAIAGVPETWTVDQIKEFQTYWDSLLEGNTAARRHMKFVPGKLALQFTRDPQLKDMYDDWLARIVCFSFSIPATAFVQAVNRATAQTAQETALSEGLIPLQQWVKSVIDQALVKFFNISDIEFSWEKTDEENPQLRAQINSQYIQMGVKSIDEVRGELGLDPIGMGNAIWAPVTNITFVSDLTDPNKRAALMQQAQPAPAGPPGSGGGDPNDPGAPGGPNGMLPGGGPPHPGMPQLAPPQSRIAGSMQALEDKLAGLRQRNEGVRGPAAFPFAQASAKADGASPLAKSISTGTGLVAVDWQSPAKNLYPAPAVRRRRRKRRGLGKADAELVAGLARRAPPEPDLDPEIVAKVCGGPIYRAALAKASRKKHPLNEIADDHADGIASGIEGSLGWLNDKADDVVDGADNADAAASAVPRKEFGDRLDDALKPLGTIAGKAGQHVASENGHDKRIQFTFDHRNPAVQDAVDAQTGDLIREVTDEQVGQVRTIVGQAMARGEPPAAMARRLRDILGLTTDQGSQVERYRAELEALDPGALDRQLRDRRYDSTVNRAIEADQALDPEQIDRMVEAYRRKYTNYRALMVARTESLRAASSGAQMTVADFMNSDDADGMQVVKTWHSADDGRVRDLHKELNKQEIVGVNTPFKLSDGREIIHPHDPEADPDLTINCRCTLSYRIEPKDVSEDS